MVENLISEHNITDLADLMKVSEKLPVLMRHYRDQAELMAVFTRFATKRAGHGGLCLCCGGAAVLCNLAQAVARREPGSTYCCTVPGTGKTELARWWLQR